MSNNRSDLLSLGEHLDLYSVADQAPEKQRGYNKMVSKFQIDRQLASSWLSLGAESQQSLVGIYLADNPVGSQVVSIWRDRGSRMFVADGMPLCTDEHGRIIPSADGTTAALVGLWETDRLTAEAGTIVSKLSKSPTADGGFWQYSTIGYLIMADYDELENHYRDIRNGVALLEARDLFGFGRPANDSTPIGGEDEPTAEELFRS
jgi:hypothetical protein